MIKTLRITIIVTAIVAVVFFVLSAVFELRHEKDKEGYLANPRATEVFKKNTKPRGEGELNAPLMKQAKAFAFRINPPKKEPEHHTDVAAAPVIVAPKFKVLGTSIHPDPRKSMALIDEPGKGVHWVMPSDKIDYLTIVKVEEGKVTYNDGKKNVEIVTERQPEIPGIIVLSHNMPGTAAKGKQDTQAVGATQPIVPQRASKEEISQNIEFIKKLMKDSNEAKSAGISTEEANGLQGMGDLLKKLEEEQKKVDANATVTEPNNPNGN